MTPAFLIIQPTDAQGNRANCTRMPTETLFRIQSIGKCLAVQWLGLWASSEWGAGLIPHQRTKILHALAQSATTPPQKKRIYKALETAWVSFKRGQVYHIMDPCVVEKFYFCYMCAFGQVIFNFPKILVSSLRKIRGPAPRAVLEQSVAPCTQCNKRYCLIKVVSYFYYYICVNRHGKICILYWQVEKSTL